MGQDVRRIAVDVIVPVFRSAMATRRCLESVLSAIQSIAFELVVVNDCSPEPEIDGYLESLAGEGQITLLKNNENLGFVASVNQSMALHPERDVVLLNSDTEVANDWLDRLRRCAYVDTSIGTATPFSNNATICSYPTFLADNPMPVAMDLADLDAVFRQVNAGKVVEIPTAMGFCMYIRRDCLKAVGLFDAERFGKGYGEENDFSRRAVAAGWRNVLCADVFVFHQGSVSFGTGNSVLRSLGVAKVRERYPDYESLIRRFVIADPVRPFRMAVDIELALLRKAHQHVSPTHEIASPKQEEGANRPDARENTRPVQLHVVHALGGGVQKWLDDYCRADSARRNLVLRPFTLSEDAAEGIALYDAASIDVEPIRLWLFSMPIGGTVTTHSEYRHVLACVLREYGVQGILVSSLIGHALDVLGTGLPTLFIHHDYYPYCPAINIHFGEVCQQCDPAQLASCHNQNHAFNVCRRYALSDKLAVRERFLELIEERGIIRVAPSRSVIECLAQLDNRFANLVNVVLPHGNDALGDAIAPDSGYDSGRLRLLVLGRLSVSKGVELLRAAIEQLMTFAEVHLLGAGEMAELFQYQPGVHIIESYSHGELPGHVQAIRPHVGLLMSIWPETYSYTLSELFMLGVPPVATNLGSFRERILSDETGFLFEASTDAMLVLLRRLDADRRALAKVRANLADLPHCTVQGMVADYHRLLPLDSSSAANLEKPVSKVAFPMPQIVESTQAKAMLDVAKFWKAYQKMEERLVYKQQAGMDLAQHLFASQEERQRLTDRVEVLTKAVELKNRELERVECELKEVFASTSWSISRPARCLGRNTRRLRKLFHCLAPLLRRPGNWFFIGRRLWTLARLSRWTGLKQAILRLPDAMGSENSALPILQKDDLVRARLLQLPRLPRISVLTPTFNTPEPMLREMLDSVLVQLYPNWQLCIADDASASPHVRSVLEEYASRDARIRLDFAEENGGVSSATNRALAMAEGVFVVLLDHDDLLEEQALFRVAEAVLEDDPDMLYSDEVLVGENGKKVQHLIFRPMFSPEYLRSHPYIVHLIGFRASLLRALGGLDESLRISQDYDLILRASERAEKIVHIPEVLYRWRIHGASAGHKMIHQVMKSSKTILQHHLQRCGEKGVVGDGRNFNFFDVRYPLVSGLKVAILIPTKNHVDLVRACIESIECTVGDVAYEIVLIDHESDDPVSLAYFERIHSRVTLLRYNGPFNFSAINNWAVAQLDGSHTHYLFCNNDIEAIEPGWLQRMLELGQKPDVGIVGAKLYYPDRKTIQHAGVVVACCGVAENLGRFRMTSDAPEDLGYIGSLICNREVTAVTAACMLIRKSVFEEVRGFDEDIAIGYGDVDLCLRVGRRGYRVQFCAHASLIHHESFTRGRSHEDPHPGDSARFIEKWGEVIESGDPYFNPNLSPHSPNWQVADPLKFKLDIRRRIFIQNPSRRSLLVESS